MRILFLHPNFPGQLVRPALLAASQGDDVKFLCQTHYGRKIPGVSRVCLKGKLGNEALERSKLNSFDKTLRIGDQFLKGMKLLKESGWDPDIIVSHSGLGCGLHSDVVWPKSHKIAYVEWWFATDAELYNFDPNNKWWNGPKNGEKLRARNLTVSLELSEANTLIAPTEWQKSQLPHFFREKCILLPDGVDCKRFKPDANMKSSTPLLTYGTRGMEAMRGFPEFIEVLPELLKKHKGLKVEIAGENRICYGGIAPNQGGFQKWAEEILEEWVTTGRVEFTGRLEPNQYEAWLQRSWIHIHLTRPFVASWSLLEAMASGCCIVASNTSPVTEFLNSSCAKIVDHRISDSLFKAIDALITDPEKREYLGEQARRQSMNWDEQRSFSAWYMLLEQIKGEVSN